MDFLDTLISGVAAVAPTVANIIVPGTGPLVHGIMRRVTGAGPDVPIETVARDIESNPALKIDFYRACTERETKLAEIAANKEVAIEQTHTARIQAVNTTMQAEAGAQGWAGKWRPYWGFVSANAFGLVVIGLVAALIVAAFKNHTDLFTHLPAIMFAITSLFAVPGAILGVASWHRGQEKRVLAGEEKVPPALIKAAMSLVKAR